MSQIHISFCFKVEDLLDRWNKKGQPVVGVIIEPIQAEGGDKFASADFFQGLRDITNKVGVKLLSFLSQSYHLRETLKQKINETN